MVNNAICNLCPYLVLLILVILAISTIRYRQVFSNIFFYFVERNARRKLKELGIDIYNNRELLPRIKKIELENELISKFSESSSTNNFINIVINAFTSFMTTFITASVSITVTLSTALSTAPTLPNSECKTRHINPDEILKFSIDNLLDITIYSLIATIIILYLITVLSSIQKIFIKIDYATNYILINILRIYNIDSK